jgi:quercetin dioxygenase-like cupin family protein
MKRAHAHSSFFAVACIVLACIASYEASGQICRPATERTGELGCWIIVNAELGKLPDGAIFWHLDTYATAAEAEAAKGRRGTVVESLGRVWLFTIDVAGWRPSSGVRIAEIGPLPVEPDSSYSAQYMEAIFTPGMTAPAHRHSGPEAWYTLSGETCLETRRQERRRAVLWFSYYTTRHNRRPPRRPTGRPEDCAKRADSALTSAAGGSKC